ncbi:MAG: GMC family oxidoreductase [Planctomycetota bacterium]
MPTLDADVCIIGAGAAGLVLAELLTLDAPTRVCIVESGPSSFADRDEPFEVRNTGKEHLGVNYGRVTAFGGTTNMWGGGLIRPSRTDFRPLDGRPETGWPIPFDEMLPHYEAIENLFEFSPDQGSTMFERDGVEVQRRDMPVLPFSKKNFGTTFGPGLRQREHVTILCDAQTEAFVGDTTQGVREIRVKQKDGTETLVRAERFVVAAGIVGTNLLAKRLLNDLGAAADHDQHGRYVHDHLSFPLARLHPKKHYAFSRRFGYRFEGGMMYGEHFDLESTDRVGLGAFFHLAFDMSTSSLLNPVREIMNFIQRGKFEEGALKPRDILGLLKGGPMLGITRYVHKRLYLDKGATILAVLDLEQMPDRRWALSETDDGCDFEWGVSDEDTEQAAALIPICWEIVERLKGESDFDVEVLMPDPKEDPAGFRAYLESDAADTYHAAGGFRMSAEENAPLDENLRLRDAPNVHLVSTAVFPRVGSSNPTHTILALAHRLAEQIRA